MVECCCCCIPIRLGTIILAAIALAASIANMSLILTHRDMYAGMDNGLRILFAVLYGVMALISFFGIVGSLVSNRRAVRLFSNTLWFIVIVNLVLNVATLVEMFQHKQELIDACVGNVTSAVGNELDNVTGPASNTFIGNSVNNTAGDITNSVQDKSRSACEKIVKIKLWATVIGYALLTLVMFYFAGVAHRFAKQLEAEFRHHRLKSHTGYRGGARQSSSRTSVAMSSV